MTQTPTITVSSTITLSPTVTATVVPAYTFKVTLYNAAGEVVRSLVPLAPAWEAGVDFEVLTKTFAPKNGGTALIRACGQTFTWDGANDSGQKVDNGMYYAKFEITDPFGHVEVRTEEVTVLSAAKQYMVRLYNSAGELVRTVQVATDSGTAAPSKISVKGDGKAIALDPAKANTVVFDLGSSSLTWDGTNDAGVLVQSGTYFVQLAAMGEGGATTVQSTSITIIEARTVNLLSQLFAVPNPASLSKDHGITIHMSNPPGTKVLGRLYNLAGECVLVTANDSDPQRLFINLDDRRLASGIYILAVWAKAPWGVVDRKSVKLAITQ
jgi:flagellar hook assembly protein FlgD